MDWSYQTNFFEGKGYFICFNDPELSNSESGNYVYDTGKSRELYRNERLLLDRLSGVQLRKSWLESLFSSNGIACAIAVAIMAVIIFLVVTANGSIAIPDVMTNALTVVLGFYFSRAGKQ